MDLTKISRLDMGAYLCIASNGIPPSVSKRIKVSVDCECIFYCFLLVSKVAIAIEKIIEFDSVWFVTGN